MGNMILDAHVDEEGKVELEIPDGLKIAPGHYKVEFKDTESRLDDDRIWTDEELKAALESHPVPANQMIAGGWEHLGIKDSAAWVEELRRKEEESQTWSSRS